MSFKLECKGKDYFGLNWIWKGWKNRFWTCSGNVSWILIIMVLLVCGRCNGLVMRVGEGWVNVDVLFLYVEFKSGVLNRGRGVSGGFL